MALLERIDKTKAAAEELLYTARNIVSKLDRGDIDLGINVAVARAYLRTIECESEEVRAMVEGLPEG